MGAQGIKRRKPKHGPPKYTTGDEEGFTDRLPPGDERRVFGRFTWGAYSPAGALERNGFFWRQVRRNADDGAFRNSLRLLYLSLPAIAFVFAATVAVIWLLSHIH